MQKLRSYLRFFWRRDWLIIKTGRPAARASMIFLAIALFLASSCSTKGGRGFGRGFSNRIDPVAAGVAGGVIGLAIIGQALSNSEREKTLQDINRSKTLLEAPCAFGGKGEATYESSAGSGNLKVIESNRNPENCKTESVVVRRAVNPYATCDQFGFLSQERLDCRDYIYREIQWRRRQAARQAAREAIERGYYR